MDKILNFCNFIVNSVGDANCIFLQNINSPIMLDCGVQNKTVLDCNNEYIKKQLEFARELIISHYHADHFNALYYIDDKSLYIQKLYYPYIPKFEFQEKLIKIINFSSFLESLSYIKSGSCAFNLVSLLNEKNSEKFSYKPLHIGMTVGSNNQYEVIWPPKDASDFDVPYLAKKIRNIEDFIKKIPELFNLWVDFDRAEIVDNQRLKLDYSKLQISKDFFKENKKIIQVIDKKVRAITNRFSVCLYFEGKFLFLGDLEKAEVSSCLRNLAKTVNCDEIFVKYFITPHHGTRNHYCAYIKNFIRSDYVISSNGKKRMRDYKQKYNKIGKYTHCTFLNGDFYGIENLSKGIVSSLSPGDIIVYCVIYSEAENLDS